MAPDCYIWYYTVVYYSTELIITEEYPVRDQSLPCVPFPNWSVSSLGRVSYAMVHPFTCMARDLLTCPLAAEVGFPSQVRSVAPGVTAIIKF